MKTAVAGLGVIGTVHTGILKSMGLEPSAVCDTQAERCGAYPSAAAYTDYFRMLDAEGLVQAQLAHAELFVELGHFIFKILYVRSFTERSRQGTDPVADPAVKDFTGTASAMVIHQNLDASCSQVFFQFCEIIIKQFFEDSEVMKSDLIDAALHSPYDLAGSAVGILIIYEEERQVRVPEIPLESMAYG